MLSITITNGGDAMHLFPLYVARAAGLFAKQGLEVDWVNVGSGTRQAASVMGGSAELTPIALYHAVRSQEEGAGLVAVMSLFDTYGMTVVLGNDALRRSGITPGMALDERVRRLAGLRIGISSPGSSTDMLIRSVLLARGMDPDRAVKLQPLGGAGPMLAAFEKGLVDGFVYVAPVPEIAVARGLGQVVVNPFTGEVPELVGVPYMVMTTSRDTLERKPALIRRAVLAIAEAEALCAQQPVEAVRLVRQYFPDVDPEVYARAAETYRAASARSPVITPEGLARNVAWLNLSGGKPVTARYEDVVDPVPAREAVAAGVGQ